MESNLVYNYLDFLSVNIAVWYNFLTTSTKAESLLQVILRLHRIIERTGTFLSVSEEVKLGAISERSWSWFLYWAGLEEIDGVSLSTGQLLGFDVGESIRFGKRVFILDVGPKVRILQDLVHANKIIICWRYLFELRMFINGIFITHNPYLSLNSSFVIVTELSIIININYRCKYKRSIDNS